MAQPQPAESRADLLEAAYDSPMLRILWLAVLLALPSCAYARSRAVDFVDIWRGAVGVGTVVGVRTRALGIVDTGLMVGNKPRISAFGLRYGTPLFSYSKDTKIDSDQAEIIRTTTVVGLDLGDGSYDSARTSAALLPVLFTWTDSTPDEPTWSVPEDGADFKAQHWIWSAETTKNNRYAQIHSLDIEVEVGLLVYLDVGYSPGEFLDFLLGFFTIDIAKDDGRFDK